jgi:tetratricopeptide (TPR) repeat protein
MSRHWRHIILGIGCLGLAGCGTPRVSTLDPVLRNDAESARAAYDNGMTAKAAELYERAMARARLMDMPDEAGRNAYNLALCQMRMGRPDEALKWLRQARLLLGKPGPAMARILVAEAEAARLLGTSAEAVKLAETVLTSGAEPAEKAQAHLLLAELSVGRGDFDAGRRHYRKASRHAAAGVPPAVGARLEGVAARLIQAGVMDGDAAACLERCANRLKETGDFRRMAESLNGAGAAYAATGRSAQAFELYIRAALSLKAAGEPAQALKSAGQAEALAAQIGDRVSRERAAILIEGMKQ